MNGPLVKFLLRNPSVLVFMGILAVFVVGVTVAIAGFCRWAISRSSGWAAI